MLPFLATELLVRCYEQQQVRDHESQRENLHGGKAVVQKHLRAHETRAPEGDGPDGEQVPKSHVVARGSHRGER